jgi:hypothetical protein
LKANDRHSSSTAYSAGRFLSRRSRDQLLEGTGIHTVPLLKNGKLSRADYEELLNSQSSFHDGVVEGVYVRIDEVLTSLLLISSVKS